MGGAGGRGLLARGDRMVPAGHHHGKGGGGVERKTNLTLPSYVWVGGETAK